MNFKDFKAIPLISIPYRYQGKGLNVLALLVFIITLYITFYFEPHTIDPKHQRFGYFWICAIHSFVPAVIFIFLSKMTYRFLKTENWNLTKEFSFILLLMVLIGIVHFLVRDTIYMNMDNWRFEFLIEELKNSISIGAIVSLVVVSINYNLMSFQHKKQAKNIQIDNLNSGKQSVGFVEDKVEGQDSTSTSSDALSILPQTFILATTEGNYTEILTDENEEIEKDILRITLSDLAQYFVKNPEILRIHKSYLVNLRKIELISGNAAGLKLKLKNVKEEVTVSRKNIPRFEERVKELSIT